MRGDKKTLLQIVKDFLFEIAVTVVFIILITLVLINEDFSKSIVTGFLRPATALTILIVLFAASVLLLLFLYIQARKKKLKSTKRMSAFAKTVERSDMAREMSQTQTVYVSDTRTNLKWNNLEDIDTNNPNIVELYFELEENLNIKE